MRKILYRGPVFNVEEYSSSVLGKKRTFVIVLERSSSIVLPILSGGRIILEKQYRRPVKKWIYELPGGHIEPGESAKGAAARELKEETGFSAKSIKYLFKTYEVPDLTAAVRHYYVATGLKPGRSKREATERISIVVIPIKKVLDMIDKDIIDDPAIICGILYYCRKFKV